MDNYKSLLERKEYDLLITLSEDDLTPDGLSYRAAAFLAKGEPRRALDIILTNRDDLYKNNPLLTMKTNFELRFILRQFDEAYDDLEYFENLPYVSQEVEEYLRTLPKLIRSEERNSSLRDKYSEDEIKEKLTSDIDDYEIISTINLIGPLKAKDYVPELMYLVRNKRSSIVKTYAFLFLIAAKCDKEVEFKKNGKVYKLIPNNVIPPFSGKSFEAFRTRLDEEINDPSISSIAKKLLNDYIFEIFPETLELENEPAIYVLALSALAHEYLSSPFDLKEECQKKDLDIGKIEAIIKRIKSVREKEETLSY